MNYFTELSIELASQYDYLDQLHQIYPLVPYMKRFISPGTSQALDRLYECILEQVLEGLNDKLKKPIATNSLKDSLFRLWLERGVLGVFPCDREVFMSNSNDAVLRGSDAELKDFAASELGFEREDKKGLDFIGRFNNIYVVGEAKFISDEGEPQNKRFLEAMELLRTPSKGNVRKVAILDGVLYNPDKKKMYSAIINKDVNVMSALLLSEYLYSIHS